MLCTIISILNIIKTYFRERYLLHYTGPGNYNFKNSVQQIIIISMNVI